MKKKKREGGEDVTITGQTNERQQGKIGFKNAAKGCRNAEMSQSNMFVRLDFLE